jgi:uncharacterized protein (DUF2336 family)
MPFFRHLFKPKLLKTLENPQNMQVFGQDCREAAKNPLPQVRKLLATRLVKLLPHLDANTHQQLFGHVMAALYHLAADDITPIRVALASALKDVAKTPQVLARQLAQDAERAVAEPMLRHSLSLSDDDLLAIINTHPLSWQTETVAERTIVAETVAAQIIATPNQAAHIALAKNDGAQITPPLKQSLATKAQNDAALKAALAARATWPRQLRQAMQQQTFLALHYYLKRQAGLNDKMADAVVQATKRRSQAGAAEIAPIAATNNDLADWLLLGEYEKIVVSLAARAHIPLEIAQKMLATQSAKPCIALCFKAGVTMRFCLDIQQRIARVPVTQLIYPKDGTDYPLDNAEIKWQLEFFSVA